MFSCVHRHEVDTHEEEAPGPFGVFAQNSNIQYKISPVIPKLMSGNISD